MNELYFRIRGNEENTYVDASWDQVIWFNVGRFSLETSDFYFRIKSADGLLNLVSEEPGSLPPPVKGRLT